MHTLKTSSKIIVFSLIAIIGIGIFFIGKYAPVVNNIKNAHNFIAEIPKVVPDYFGEIISKEGNLLIIKYFEKKGTAIEKIKTKKDFLFFLKNASIQDKLKIKASLEQKVLGNISVLVPLQTPIYLEEKSPPKPITFHQLEKGNFIVIWGNLNEKGQIISDFMVTANPKKYEQK